MSSGLVRASGKGEETQFLVAARQVRAGNGINLPSRRPETRRATM